jgi:hypothetical protein
MGKMRFTVNGLTSIGCFGQLRCVGLGHLIPALATLALVNATAVAQVQAGFAGYTWGTPFEQMERQLDLKPVRHTRHTVQYSTNLQEIEEIDHIECDLEFTDGLFSGVVLFVQRSHIGDILPALLTRYYGKPRREGPRAYHWLTAETDATYDEGSEEDAYVYIYARRFLRGRYAHAP